MEKTCTEEDGISAIVGDDSPTCPSELEALSGKVQFLKRFYEVNCEDVDQSEDNECGSSDFEEKMSACLFLDANEAVENVLKLESIQDDDDCSELSSSNEDKFGGINFYTCKKT